MAATPLRVLILEDRTEDAELIVRALRRDGFDPVSRRVDQIDHYLAALDEPWDVILSDYSMPQFGAPQALELLRERAIDTPFLVITGSISEEVAVECMKRGAADYLIKDRLTRLGPAVLQALESRQARRLRAAAENDLRLTQHAVDHIPLAVIRTDPAGRITYANDAASALTGHAPAALTALRFYDLKADPDPDAWAATVLALRYGGAPTTEAALRRADGVIFPAEVTASFFEFAGAGHIFYFIADITERKRAHALLLESEKMRTVAGLAAGMAHEINNPLAAILQSAQVVLSRVDPNRPANRAAADAAGTTIDAVDRYFRARAVPELLTSVRDAGRRAAGIVQNMLNFSRSKDTEHLRQPVEQLLDNTLELAQADFEPGSDRDFKKITIVREYQPDLPPISGDRSELQQVFLNLLKNAAYAMFSNPGPAAPPHIILRARRDRDHVVIEVQDNGPGMPETVRKRAFEPFFTTKPTGEGTGLGLSVSYFIITQNHGGTMTVDSAPGRGARFVISLPVYSEIGNTHAH